MTADRYGLRARSLLPPHEHTHTHILKCLFLSACRVTTVPQRRRKAPSDRNAAHARYTADGRKDPACQQEHVPPMFTCQLCTLPSSCHCLLLVPVVQPRCPLCFSCPPSPLHKPTFSRDRRSPLSLGTEKRAPANTSPRQIKI